MGTSLGLTSGRFLGGELAADPSICLIQAWQGLSTRSCLLDVEVPSPTGAEPPPGDAGQAQPSCMIPRHIQTVGPC